MYFFDIFWVRLLYMYVIYFFPLFPVTRFYYSSAKRSTETRLGYCFSNNLKQKPIVVRVERISSRTAPMQAIMHKRPYCVQKMQPLFLHKYKHDRPQSFICICLHLLLFLLIAKKWTKIVKWLCVPRWCWIATVAVQGEKGGSHYRKSIQNKDTARDKLRCGHGSLICRAYLY